MKNKKQQFIPTPTDEQFQALTKAYQYFNKERVRNKFVILGSLFCS